MKKLSLYLFSLFTITVFTACNEDFNENVAAPQTNEPEEPVSPSFQVTNATTTDFNLNEITAEFVEVANGSSLTSEEGTTVTYKLSIDKTNTYENRIAYELSAPDNTLKIATSDLQAAIQILYGRLSEPREVFIRVNAYVRNSAGQTSLIYSNDLNITVTPIDPVMQFYVPGGYQGWVSGVAPIVYDRDFDMKYDGYVFISSEEGLSEEDLKNARSFKFISEVSWLNYGDSETAGVLSIGGGNLTVPETGFYRLFVNLSGNPPTYTATKTEWGVVGGATEKGWEESTSMTLDPTTGEWTVITTLDATGAYKFRANDNWDINLGGNLSDLNYGDDNISVSEGTGTYKITLNLSDPKAYKATVNKISD
jgi:hypothetical protein